MLSRLGLLMLWVRSALTAVTVAIERRRYDAPVGRTIRADVLPSREQDHTSNSRDHPSNLDTGEPFPAEAPREQNGHRRVEGVEHGDDAEQTGGDRYGVRPFAPRSASPTKPSTGGSLVLDRTPDPVVSRRRPASSPESAGCPRPAPGTAASGRNPARPPQQAAAAAARRRRTPRARWRGSRRPPRRRYRPVARHSGARRPTDRPAPVRAGPARRWARRPGSPPGCGTARPRNGRRFPRGHWTTGRSAALIGAMMTRPNGAGSRREPTARRPALRPGAT